MHQVLESTRRVVENASAVSINEENVQEFLSTFEEAAIRHWLDEAPEGLATMPPQQRLQLLLVFNAISFSYWGTPKWTVAYRGRSYDGAWGMLVSLLRAVADGVPVLDARWLRGVSSAQIEHVTHGNVRIPLCEERAAILREIGGALVQRYDGSFECMVREAQGDAMRLLDIIIRQCPSFTDTRPYKGEEVYFYKRAQLLVADVHQAFKGQDYGALKNTERLTACADYKLPQVLRALGILRYAPSLSERIDRRIEIPPGSEEEIEIRASTIWAVELLRQTLASRIPSITSTQINDCLWLRGQDKSLHPKPYHLTRTTAY